MSLKNDRISKIKSFLRMQSSPVTVTEIHAALSKRMHLDVSRKTIERDIIELADALAVSVVQGVPSRYSLGKRIGVELVLMEDEVVYILKLLGPETELYLKLKKCLLLNFSE